MNEARKQRKLHSVSFSGRETEPNEAKQPKEIKSRFSSANKPLKITKRLSASKRIEESATSALIREWKVKHPGLMPELYMKRHFREEAEEIEQRKILEQEKGQTEEFIKNNQKEINKQEEPKKKMVLPSQEVFVKFKKDQKTKNRLKMVSYKKEKMREMAGNTNKQEEFLKLCTEYYFEMKLNERRNEVKEGAHKKLKEMKILDLKDLKDPYGNPIPYDVSNYISKKPKKPEKKLDHIRKLALKRIEEDRMKGFDREEKRAESAQSRNYVGEAIELRDKFQLKLGKMKNMGRLYRIQNKCEKVTKKFEKMSRKIEKATEI